MANNEERIKAFFSNSENLKALAKDSEFIEKLAAGNVTPETCRKEFEELGLSLTLDEAQELLKSTQRAMDMSPEELDNVVLETVSGGGKGTFWALKGGEWLADLAAFGCSVAGVVYQFKAKDELEHGNLELGKKYNNRSLQFWGASLGFRLGGGVLNVSSRFAADGSRDKGLPG